MRMELVSSFLEAVGLGLATWQSPGEFLGGADGLPFGFIGLGGCLGCCVSKRLPGHVNAGRAPGVRPDGPGGLHWAGVATPLLCSPLGVPRRG